MATYSKTRLGFLNRETYTLYLAYRNPKTPIAAKLMGLLTLIYLIVPFDIITDVIPIIGWVDDFAVAYILSKLAVSIVPPDIMEECRLESERRGKKIIQVIIAVMACLFVISIFLLILLIKALSHLIATLF